MKARILDFLKAENKSSAQLAEEIGVQASGISHILSGRNNPSLDFVLKMLDKYKYLSTDWLLFGKGSMYKDTKMQTLFDEDSVINYNEDNIIRDNKPGISELEMPKVKKEDQSGISPTRSKKETAVIQKIVWFYDNNTFEEFKPLQ